MFIILLLISTATANICSFKADSIISYDEAVDCLKTVKLNASFYEQEKVITALKKYAKLSANRDTILYPPFASIDPIDLQSELDKIGKQKYESAIDFYSEISNLFKQLKDPHTLFQKPCGGIFTFVLPYGLLAEGNKTSPQNIKLKLNSIRGTKLLSVTQRYFDDIQDAVDLNGRQIMHLSDNGTDDSQFSDQHTSAQELSLWAEKEIYESKFSAARFTRALDSSFSIRQAVVDQIPPTKFVKLWLKQIIPDQSDIESESEINQKINQISDQIENSKIQENANEEQYDEIYLPFYAIVNQDIDGDDLSIYCPLEEDKQNIYNKQNNEKDLTSENEQEKYKNIFNGLKYNRIIEDMNNQLINDNSEIQFEQQQSHQLTNDDKINLVHSGEGIQFYVIQDPDTEITGFIRISSFYPAGKQLKIETQIDKDKQKNQQLNNNNQNYSINTSTNPAVEKFVDDVTIGTNILVQNKVERLIIDVRGNQGGYGELAARILRYLTGRKGTDEELKKADDQDNRYYINYNNNVFPLMGEFDSPKSKLHTLLHKHKVFPKKSEKMRSNIAEYEQRKILEKRKWYQIGTVRKEFGKENEKQNVKEMNKKAHYSLYTTKFTRERTEEEQSWDKQIYNTINKGSQLNIKEKNMLFVTDGLCQGACSMFLQRASELGIGKTVFVGQSPLDISNQDKIMNQNEQNNKEYKQLNGQQQHQQQSINSLTSSPTSIISAPGSFVTDSNYLQELRQFVKNNKKLPISARKNILKEFPLPFPRKGTALRFPYEEVFGLKEKGPEHNTISNSNTNEIQQINASSHSNSIPASNSFKYSTFSNNLAFTPIPPDIYIPTYFPTPDSYSRAEIYIFFEFNLKNVYESCVNWEVEEDDDKCKGKINSALKPAPNAIYGHPCVLTTKQNQQQQYQQSESESNQQIDYSSPNSQYSFDQTKCVFARCMNGHFLVNDPGKIQRVSTNTTWRPICEPIYFIDTSALGITKDAQSYMFTERTTESDVALFDKISWVFIVPYGIAMGIISGCLWVLFIFRDGWKRRTQERKGYTEIASDMNQGFDVRVNQGAAQSELELRGVGNSINSTQSE